MRQVGEAQVPRSARKGVGGTIAQVIAISVASLLVLGLFLFAGPVQRGAVGGAPGVQPHIIVNVAAADSSMVNYVLSSSVMPYLRAGDAIDVNHPPDEPINASYLAEVNTVAQEFGEAAPAGVTISAHSGYIDQVGALANGTRAPVTEVVAVLEPNGVTPGLSYTFDSALSYFEEANELDHARGLASVAYPTGSFLTGGLQSEYGWNYGQLAATSDQIWVEMQTYAYNDGDPSPSVWSSAIGALVSQMNGTGQPLSKLAVQINLGDPTQPLGAMVRAVTAATALADIKAAQEAGIENIDLWTGFGDPSENPYESYLGATLAGLNRTMTSPPPPCCVRNAGPGDVLPHEWGTAGILGLSSTHFAVLVPAKWKAVGAALPVAIVIPLASTSSRRPDDAQRHRTGFRPFSELEESTPKTRFRLGG